MLGTVHTTTPTRVRLEHDTTPDPLAALLGALGTATVAVLVFTWRAPLLVLALGLVLAGLGAVWAGHSAALLAVLALFGVVVAVVAWYRPAWLRRSADLVVGQWLRVFVYRPRWETACHTAQVTTRARSDIHVPALVRHRRRHGVDTLTVRMAPGQTLTDWAAACPALASTFGAYSMTAAPTVRPGWVRLDGQRRDPLAQDRASADPARAGTGPIELGRDEFGAAFTIDPTTTVHMGLQGAARSGKSSACYTLLGALAYRADVAVVGVDPSGLLLGPFQAGPNAHLIACGTAGPELEHAAGVLGELVDQMDQRIRSLRRAGLDKFTTYSPAMPALWVVMEEYPGLITALKAHDSAAALKPAERLAPTVERHIGRLVKEGAKVGVCVLFIAQRMSAEALATDDRANLAVRCTLRVDNTDAVRMLHDGITNAGMERIRQFAPGVGLVESPGAPLRRVRFHFTDYATYRARVAAGLRNNTARVGLGEVLVGEVVTLPTDPTTGDADVPHTQPIPLGGAA